MSVFVPFQKLLEVARTTLWTSTCLPSSNAKVTLVKSVSFLSSANEDFWLSSKSFHVRKSFSELSIVPNNIIIVKLAHCSYFPQLGPVLTLAAAAEPDGSAARPRSCSCCSFCSFSSPSSSSCCSYSASVAGCSFSFAAATVYSSACFSVV